MAYKYIQIWGKYRGAAGAMFRFYFGSNPESENDFSPASLVAWKAVHVSLQKLSESERDIIRSYYTDLPDKRTRHDDPMKAVSRKYRIPISEARSIIDKAIRTVVVERGLADE